MKSVYTLYIQYQLSYCFVVGAIDALHLFDASDDVLIATLADDDLAFERLEYPLALLAVRFSYHDHGGSLFHSYSMKVSAFPRLSARPVRPMRWT